jgi:hypothetical protein
MVVALVAAGCAKAAEKALEEAIERQLEEEGGGDVNIDLDEDGGVVSIETEEGSIDIGGTEIPDDFLLPIPDQREVLGVVIQTGEYASSTVTLSFDPDDFDDVAALYEDFFNDQGWEVSRTDSSGDGNRLVILSGTSDELTASAIIGYNDDDDVATLTAQYGNN